VEWTIQWRTESFDGGLYEFVTNDRLNSYLSLRISTKLSGKNYPQTPDSSREPLQVWQQAVDFV